MANTSLKKAKKAKNDEFYTQLSDIERELKHYKKHFKDKIVYCNADDPFESNFFKFFASNFNMLGLKKLLTTSYEGSPIVGKQLSLFDIKGVKSVNQKEPMKIEINEVKDFNKDGAVDIADIEYLLKYDKNTATPLEGSGDFRSKECVNILKEADIIVTNPPFSLFREYVSQLIEFNKKFVIIGNKNAITYKEIFSLIKENKMWVGHTPMSTDMLFDVPEDYAKELIATKKEGSGYKILNGVVKGRAQAVWFTNLDISKRHEDLILYKTYEGNEDEFPIYDNYNAINIGKTKDILIDYKGVMGVPITYLDKYNPDQFKILGMSASAGYDKEIVGIPFLGEKDARPLINGKNTYARVFIKNKKL